MNTSKEDDKSGKYIFDLIENDYTVKSWEIIPDEKENLTDEIEKLISDDVDVIRGENRNLAARYDCAEWVKRVDSICREFNLKG